MKRAILIIAAAATLWLSARVAAQRSATTTLQVRVAPESHLVPTRLTLSFRVSPDGIGDLTTRTALIAAWVRALPGQHIRLTALPGALTGPAGPVSAAAIRWTGVSTRATAGGQEATCTAGSFDTPTPQDLVAGWTRSGTLTCAVTFSLADPRSVPVGGYTSIVDLSLRAK